MSDDDNSVAPKERVNIVYKSRAQGNQDVELPFKLMVTGEFSFKEQSAPIGERSLVDINADNFDQVMKSMGLSVDIDEKDPTSDVQDARLQAKLQISSLKDMTPDGIVQQVPEMKRQLDLATALQEVKSDLANPRKLAALREKIQAVLNDEDAKKKLDELKKNLL